MESLKANTEMLKLQLNFLGFPISSNEHPQ